MESVEKECGALGGLFQAIVSDMKVTHMQIEIDKDNVWAFVVAQWTIRRIIFFFFTAFVSFTGSSPTGNAAAGQIERWNMFPFVWFA